MLKDKEISIPKTYVEESHRIVCSAMKFEDGTIICSVRHYDNFVHDILKINQLHGPHVQGFVDNKREFLTREEAWIVAEKAGQIIRRCGGDEKQDGTGRLYSENLY